MIKEIKTGPNCPKKWSEMEGGEAKKLCNSCNHMVYDFTKFSTEEIIEFLEKRRGEKTCGKLNSVQIEPQNKKYKKIRYAHLFTPLLLVAALAIFTACNSNKKLNDKARFTPIKRIKTVAYGINPDSLKTILIKGRITDQMGEPLISANLKVYNSEYKTTTDFSGEFEIEFPRKNFDLRNIITAKYTGYSDFQFRVLDVKNKEIAFYLSESLLIGEIIIKKQPIHKRVWNRIKNVFRRK